MLQIKTFLKELQKESITTKKMLNCVPNDQFEWQPHPKSMKMRSLVTHIAELPTWITLALTTEGLDFEAEPYNPVIINSKEELIELFEKSLLDGQTHLVESNENKLEEKWTLSSGATILMESTKAETIRHSLSQIIHHRAQLGVYLRLLNIPIPGSYGPSADEQGF